MSKTIFITGTSSGIGKATAKYFHEKGWKVIATMRTPEKETELNKLENVILLPLDVTNLEQINETVEKAITIGVDVVFNNAGYGLVGALEALSDEKITKMLNTNLLGVIRITKAFIPYFRKKKSGMFITTTSLGGFVGFPIYSIYHASKFALEGWSESLSFELSKFNINVKTIAPGYIHTDFITRSLDKNSHPEYKDIEDKILGGKDEESMKQCTTPEEVAPIVYEAATDGKDQIRYVVGKDAIGLQQRQLEIGRENLRKEISKQFGL